MSSVSAGGGMERWFGVTSFFGLGVLSGAVLLLVLLIVLPRGVRSRLAAPAALMVLHVLLEAVGWQIPGSAVVSRPLAVLSVLALLLAHGRGAFVLVADGIFAGRLGRPLPRIFRDILQTVIYSAIALFTLRFVGVEPGSLLTTSALLTAVVGLSLQDTLGNLFAGLSIQVQRPFQVGDWIQFDPDPRLIGRVIEINWRATTVLTNDEMEIIVPNGTLAKAPIRNYTKPSPLSRRSVEVSCSYDVAPSRVRDTILGALGGLPDVLRKPAPLVLAWHFGQSGVDYVVQYYTDKFANREISDSVVRERIWYALRRERISIPYPMREVNVRQMTREVDREVEGARRAQVASYLRSVDFLAILPEEALLRLAELAPSRVYAPGETVIVQGGPGQEMFFVARGEVSVIVGQGGGSAEVARLHQGSFFGEMSLMTGELRAATVQVVHEAELVVVGKEAFSAILSHAPELAARMSHVIVERQEQLDSHLAARAAQAEPDVIEQRASDLLVRVKKFFQL